MIHMTIPDAAFEDHEVNARAKNEAASNFVTKYCVFGPDTVCQIKNETTNVYSIFSSRIMYPFSIRLICTIFISVLLLYVSSRLSLICLNPPVSYTSVKLLSLDGQKGYTLSIGLNNHLSVLLSYAPPFKNFFSIHFISLYGR